MNIQIDKLKRLLQSIDTYRYIMMVLLFYRIIMYCIDYVNAGSGYQQTIAFRSMSFLFGVLILLNMKWEDVCNLWNLIYIPIFGVCTAVVYKFALTDLTFQDCFIAGILTMLVWGWAVLAILRRLIKKGLPELNIPMSVSWILFVGCMIYFRHDFFWSIFFLVPFTVYYLLDLDDRAYSFLFSALCNGAALSFLHHTYRSLHYRPFDKDRYWGMFQNANAAGLYLGTVAVILFVQVCILWKKKKNIVSIIGLCIYYILLTAVLCFDILSGTRTSLFGLLMMFAVYLIVQLYVREKWYKPVSQILIIGVLTAVLFVPAYSAARYIPAYFIEKGQDPYWFDGDYDEEVVIKGEKSDSEKYTSMYKFIRNFFKKFGIDIYGVGMEVSDDVTNGRMEVYQSFLGEINTSGHETQYLEVTEGTKQSDDTEEVAAVSGDNEEDAEEEVVTAFYWHAHDTYLEIFYIYGAITGVMFLIFCGVLGVSAVCFYIKKRETFEYAIFPMLMVVMYLTCCIPEWCGHPAQTNCLLLYVSIGVLFKEKTLLSFEKKKVEENDF